MPTLADIYSAADSFKRRLADAASNPSGSLQQMLGYANDRARNLRELERQADAEIKQGGFANQGPATQELNRMTAEAVMAGMTKPNFQTGLPVKFPFIKNTESAPRLQGFGQDIEPHGNYVLSGHDVNLENLPEKWISGQMEFKNPLVLDWGKSGLYSEPDNWKQVLKDQYKGKTGKALSKAIAKDGYDAIVTIRDNEPSEIVDLSRFIAPK